MGVQVSGYLAAEQSGVPQSVTHSPEDSAYPSTYPPTG